MKENELRIGNLVWNDLPFGNPKIINIEHYHFNQISDDIKNENFIPIPLTEEWLLKFGFEKNEISTSLKDFYIINYQLENFVVYLLESSFEIELINKSGEQFNLFINQKKQVHILQNLYFYLTGKELEII